MKKLKLILPLLFLSSFIKAQDSTKTVNHEIGFNTVLLVKQLISNNPTNTLDQLPYAIFYNLYFKDKFGLRVGLGLNNSRNETKIDGQNTPRKTDLKTLNLRTGFSYNFVKQNRITLNAFADYIIESSTMETSNTFTTQSFPNPVEEITMVTADKTRGVGAQAGVGLKFNLYKHLSIYAEIPLSIVARTITSEVRVVETGVDDTKTLTTTKDVSTRITLPTTLYLVLRF